MEIEWNYLISIIKGFFKRLIQEYASKKLGKQCQSTIELLQNEAKTLSEPQLSHFYHQLISHKIGELSFVTGGTDLATYVL